MIRPCHAGIQLSAHAAAPGTAGKAAHTFELAGEPPEWVQLLPAGIFLGRDGRGPYQVPNPEEVIRLTLERTGADLPIDYGHALELEGHQGDSARAAGWISGFEVRDDGEIWGRVHWTGSGEAAIRGREYRFLSPVFYHDADGAVLWILRAGLTNRPNLKLKSINANQAGDDAGKENSVSAATNNLAPVAAALGLAATADEAAIVARCSQATQAQAGLTRVAQSLELTETASVDEVIRAINARTTPDPTRFVPRSQYDEVSTQLLAAQSREGVREVDAAVQSGKLAPAQREWALAYHSRDAKGFAEFIEKQPVVVAPGPEGERASAQSRTVDEDAKAVCAALGIQVEDFTKNMG